MSRAARKAWSRWGGVVAIAAAVAGPVLVWFIATQDAAPPAAPASPAAASPAPMPMMGARTFTAPAPSPSETAKQEALCPGCDVVVITLCSVRWDYLSSYGVHPGLTPALDRIAAEGVRFTHAWSASNFTLASLTAVLTGQFPSTTGVITWDKGLTANVPTLPEVLGLYGYRTGAFTIDAPSGFRPDYGLHRGFQTMQIIAPPRDTPDGRTGAGDPGAGGLSVAPAIAWLAAQPKDAPIFLMHHNRTAHFPFVLSPPAPGTDPTGVLQGLFDAGREQVRKPGQAMPGTAGGTAQKGVVALQGEDPLQVLIREQGAPAEAAWRQAYADAVRNMDRDIAALYAALEQRGRLDKTILLVVADHGESLNDHGELLHGDAYWDSVVHVPLLIRIPGVSPGTTQAALASHVDLMPTLLEAVGAVPPADIDGTSLVPVLRGQAAQVRSTLLIEGGVALRNSSVPRGAVITPEWSLIRQDRGCGAGAGMVRPGEPPICLFQLSSDPQQLQEVSAAHPEVVQDLVQRWDAYRAARASSGLTLDLNPAYIEELQKTGYNFKPGNNTPSGAP